MTAESGGAREGIILTADYFEFLRLHEAGSRNAIALPSETLSDRQRALLADLVGEGGKITLVLKRGDPRAIELLSGLAEQGFGKDQLAEMQKIIDAEKSDLFDVLAYVAYALPPLTREERAGNAKVVISTHFTSKQQVFLDFVLSHYVRVGVEELGQDKLTPLLRLRYHDSISDAIADLGKPAEIQGVFVHFQKWLYVRQAA